MNCASRRLLGASFSPGLFVVLSSLFGFWRLLAFGIWPAAQGDRQMLKKFSLAVARLPRNCPCLPIGALRCGERLMHRLSLNRRLHLIVFVPLLALAVFG